MSIKDRQNPESAPAAQAAIKPSRKAAAKEARLAAALRANLAKRKNQARTRAESPPKAPRPA